MASVDAYGGVSDGKRNTAATLSGGGTSLTIDSGAGDVFTAADVGKPIVVCRAGSPNLETTISARTSETEVTLAASGSSIGATLVVWGTDNQSAIQETVDALATGGAVEFGSGNYFLLGEVTVPVQNVNIRGLGPGATQLFQGSGTANTFNFTVGGFQQNVSDLSIYGLAAAQTGGSAITFSGTDGPSFMGGLTNVCVRDYYNGVNLAGTTNKSGVASLLNVEMFEINNICVDLNADGLIWSRGRAVSVAVTLSGLATTLGSTTLTAAAPTFTPMDVGKRIRVSDAGASGAALVTTITGYNSSQNVTLASAASTAVSGKAGILSPNTACGVNVSKCGGLYLLDLDIVGVNIGVNLAPGASTAASYGLFTNLLTDSCFDVGLNIAPTSTGAVASLVATNCWFASSGESTAHRNGIRVAGGASTTVTALDFVACRVINNGYAGADISYATGVTFRDCIFDGNSGHASGSYPAVDVANASNFTFVNNTVSHRYFSSGTTYSDGVKLAASVTGNIIITNNVIESFSGSAVADSSTVTTKLVADNLPVSAQSGSYFDSRGALRTKESSRVAPWIEGQWIATNATSISSTTVADIDPDGAGGTAKISFTPNADLRVQVCATFDLQAPVTYDASSLFVGELDVYDGSSHGYQPGQVVFNPGGTTCRATVSQVWNFTLTAGTTYTIKLVGRVNASGSTYVVQATHTKMSLLALARF